MTILLESIYLIETILVRRYGTCFSSRIDQIFSRTLNKVLLIFEALFSGMVLIEATSRMLRA